MPTSTPKSSASVIKRQSKRRIVLVDDHALLRRGVAELINSEPSLEVCGEAGTFAEAHSQVAKLNPDLVIVDISLEGNDGMELTKELCHRWPELPVLAYSMHDEDIYAERSLRAGAKGYVMKRHPPETLLEAIGQVLHGKVFLSSKMSERLLGKMVGHSELPTQSPMETLSDRELEVLRLIGQGNSTAEIADKLCVSHKTVETHRDHLRHKLNFQSSRELMRHAVEWVVKQT